MHEAKAEIVANVWKLVASPGDEVGAGDVIAVLETMKMEIPVIAPRRRNVSTRCGSPRGRSSRRATSSRSSSDRLP